jgi:ABC-type uncharacterized transport system substrate-binding protein
MKGEPMRRRELITFLGGATAAWPLAARAQQQAMPVIGYLDPGTPEWNANVLVAFRKGLSEHGFTEGRNVAIEYRLAHNDANRVPELAADLVSRRVAVIATVGGSAPALAAQAATKTIPIVFAIGRDPVEFDLVASFNRPGGNITGITTMTNELEGKRLGLLRELVPRAMRIGYLVSDFNNQSRIRYVQTASAALGAQIEPLRAGTSREINDAFANLAQKRIDAVLTGASPVLYGFRAHLATAAARAGVPVMSGERAYTDAGGLMSYGTDILDVSRLLGVYVGRILKGEKPATYR